MCWFWTCCLSCFKK
jgi:hypothetical protein